MSGPFGGRVFIADTSAWARADLSSVRRRFGAALRNRQIATCAIVSLELRHSARNGSELDEVQDCSPNSVTSQSDAP